MSREFFDRTSSACVAAPVDIVCVVLMPLSEIRAGENPWPEFLWQRPERRRTTTPRGTCVFRCDIHILSHMMSLCTACWGEKLCELRFRGALLCSQHNTDTSNKKNLLIKSTLISNLLELGVSTQLQSMVQLINDAMNATIFIANNIEWQCTHTRRIYPVLEHISHTQSRKSDMHIHTL